MTTHTYPYRGTRTDQTRILKAVLRHKPVTIEYEKSDGTRVLRTIEPTDVARTQHGNEVLYALDRDSSQPRTWRFDRIRAYTIHNGKFVL